MTSNSSIALFASCPRNYYYKYVKHYEPEDSLTLYGDAGTVVHTALEQYSEVSLDIFEKLWEEQKLSDQIGLFGHKLKKNLYEQSVKNGLSKKYKILRVEERIKLGDYVGIIDVIAKAEDRFFKNETFSDIYDDIIIVDWKTSSKVGTKQQMKFYAYLWYMKYNKLPKMLIWDYLKINKTVKMIPTTKDVDDMHKFLNDFNRLISIKTDWEKTNNCLFCQYKKRCKHDE